MTKKLTKVAMTTALAAAAIVPAVVATPAQAAEAEVTFAKAYYTTANGTAAFEAGKLAGVIGATSNTKITYVEGSNGEVFPMSAFSGYLAVNPTATTDEVLTALSKAGKALSADQVKALNVKEGKVVNGKVTVDADAPVADVKVESVKAINATTATVNFANALPQNVDFTNFDINGNSTVTDVKFSQDRKTATITVNPEFVRNQEYTVSVFGIKDANGKEFAETKGKFVWEVAEGVVVALDATTLEQGQTIGLTVKDAAGKDVKDAKVKVTSLNTNLVTENSSGGKVAPSTVKIKANNDKLAGTTDILVETELPDGSILNNTFKVTVKEAVTAVANAGYTLIPTPTVSGTTSLANALAFKEYGKQVTSLIEGTGPVDLIAFGETNGNPDVTHLDFTDAKVTSSNAIVATAIVDGSSIKVTPLRVGTSTLQVTMKDGSRKSFPVTVTAAPVISDLTVSATTVKLSDENRTETVADGKTGQLGVDAQKVTVKTIDQYKDALQPVGGKVTVTSNTEGIKLFDDAAGTTEYTTTANTVTLSSGATDFYIQAQKDKPVSNAKVTVSYFKNANDTKPAITKTITVNVADIDITDLTADIDVVAGNEIDANAKNLTSGVDEIDFSTEVYAVNSKGHRIENLSTSATTTATLDSKNTDAAKFVEGTGAKVSFGSKTSEALTYLRAASTVNVEVAVTEGVTGPSANQTVTKIVPVTYKNTAVVPNKATVATSPISIKLPAPGTITFDEIIFGKLDADQLIKDDVTKFDLVTTHAANYIAPLKTAKNAGYEFNKSIISITGTDGKAMNIGAGLYGNIATSQEDGNIWFTKAIEDLTKSTTKFVTGSEEFEYEFAIANVAGDVTPSATDVTLAAGQSSTFTLVLSGVYVKDSVKNVESVSNLTSATSEQKAKHNLLAAPVQLNVSVSAE